MRNFHTYVTPGFCPKCSRLIECSSSPFKGNPKPGDASVCIECGAILTFGEDMMPRLPSPEEMLMMAIQPQWLSIVSAQQYIKKRGPLPPLPES